MVINAIFFNGLCLSFVDSLFFCARARAQVARDEIANAGKDRNHKMGRDSVCYLRQHLIMIQNH